MIQKYWELSKDSTFYIYAICPFLLDFTFLAEAIFYRRVKYSYAKEMDLKKRIDKGLKCVACVRRENYKIKWS
jgi:hypothetical protein